MPSNALVTRQTLTEALTAFAARRRERFGTVVDIPPEIEVRVGNPKEYGAIMLSSMATLAQPKRRFSSERQIGRRRGK